MLRPVPVYAFCIILRAVLFVMKNNCVVVHVETLVHFVVLVAVDCTAQKLRA